MTRTAFGMMVGMIGSALGFWYWSRQFSEAAPVPARGTVIFRNTPTAGGEV